MVAPQAGVRPEAAAAQRGEEKTLVHKRVQPNHRNIEINP